MTAQQQAQLIAKARQAIRADVDYIAGLYAEDDRRNAVVGAATLVAQKAEAQLDELEAALAAPQAPQEQEKEKDQESRVDDTQYDSPSARPLATAAEARAGSGHKP